ncbi:MAG: 2-amino-4-hydroxy-6-hydroxymethyldihydropteridine diphosphokinase [Corticimicrobacter sp.]|uniref:2-amino-4-hydroxy-6- hydroxymethyldihydropteridine diphosphokinase n=1 Tax=Corticimicrobacter sp. TaxID=2678536 RepID=UPI0032DA83C4
MSAERTTGSRPVATPSTGTRTRSVASVPDEHPVGHIQAWIGLGANLGNPLVTLQMALRELAQAGDVIVQATSPFYRTAPVDSSGPDYVNAVTRIVTSLAPHVLLALLQRIEQQHGRQRPYQNAPRTLDLDLLLYGKLRIDDDTLVVPHPRMHLRAFVLRPLLDIEETDMMIEGQPLQQWLARLGDTQPLQKLPA